MHEGDGRDHLPLLVCVEHGLLQIQVLRQDGPVARERQLPQPQAQVLQEAAVGGRGPHPVADQQQVRVPDRGRHDGPVQGRSLEAVEEREVQVVEVGLL